MDNHSYTTEEVAQILKVSKLTIYDLVKKGLLPTFRVGRQMRIDPKDLDEYINRSKKEVESISNYENNEAPLQKNNNVLVLYIQGKLL